MRNKRLSWLSVALLVLLAPLSQAAHHGDKHSDSVTATIADLSWMTGSYSVEFGPMTLEENWTSAGNGSIAALVRMSGAGKTSMIELIVIEEQGDSLELHIQQWDSGYKPRAQGAITMKLVAIGDSSVRFEAVTKGGLKRLGYTKKGDDFTISLVDAEDKAQDIGLKAR